MIGIDSLDSKLLSRFDRDLPNLRRLKEKSPEIKLKSVYPPDSTTAWASIYTGLNPAKTGIVAFVDPLEKVTSVATKDVGSDILPGNTFLFNGITGFLYTHPYGLFFVQRGQAQGYGNVLPFLRFYETIEVPEVRMMECISFDPVAFHRTPRCRWLSSPQ